MIKPTQGLSAGPLLLAVVALAAASASIGLAAGRPASSDEPIATSAGARGPAKDAKSDATNYARVEGPVRTLAPAGDPSGNDVGSASALCPSGMRVISGGYQMMTGGGETFYSNAPAGGRVGWAVGAVNNLATPGTVQAFAYCVRSGKAAGNRRTLTRRRAAAKRQMEALVDRYRARRAPQL